METAISAAQTVRSELDNETGTSIAPVVESVASDIPVQDKISTPVPHIPHNRQTRHSKRVSLNIPISVQFQRKGTDSPSHFSDSPGSLSGHSTPQSQTNPSSSALLGALTTPLTPPSESPEDTVASTTINHKQTMRRSHARSHTLAHTEWSSLTTPSHEVSPVESTQHLDFLTLLAGQERRVLELREELNRAETELQTLKKQWAVHEANRKKGELRNGGVVKMDTLRSPAANTDPQHGKQRMKGHARSATLAVGTGLGLDLDLDIVEEGQPNDDAELRQEMRRASVQERYRKRGTTLEGVRNAPSIPGRRNGQRVFSSSKHTRTLSLLNNTPKLDSTKSLQKHPSTIQNTSALEPKSTTESKGTAIGFPSLTRSNSGFGRDLNFGKTYKDLASAASRRTIPQGADVLMKHGKVVVDGVRDGLWSFFEDIRQATVGEEAAREASANGNITNGAIRNPVGGIHGKTRTGTTDMQVSPHDAQTSAEQSFWKEFGVETPRADRKKTTTSTNRISKANVKSGHKPAQCSKHAHSTSQSPENDESFDQAATVTSPNTNSDLLDEQSSSVKSRADIQTYPKKKDRISHASTDSGDSRDSRNPPSLTMDSPFGGSTRNTDTDIEDDADVDDTWSWKSDSPSQVRKFTKLDTVPIPVPPIEQHTRQQSHEGYEWHALTR